MNRTQEALDVGNLSELQRLRDIYENQLLRGPPSPKAQFDYARCLVKSRNKSDIEEGILFLEDLFQKTKDDSVRSDYLFFLSVGHTRLKEYNKALKYCTAILKVEPRNLFALELRDYINKMMRKDGLIGVAVVGSVVLVIGAIVGLIVAMKRKK